MNFFLNENLEYTFGKKREGGWIFCPGKGVNCGPLQWCPESQCTFTNPKLVYGEIVTNGKLKKFLGRKVTVMSGGHWHKQFIQ